MFAGDFSRKSTLVEHGFRLPSALDNRPLRFDEWETKLGPRIYVSATPSDYELAMSGGEVVEQVIRPPASSIPSFASSPLAARCRPSSLRVDDAPRKASASSSRPSPNASPKNSRDYMKEQGLRCKWLHSELDAFERVTILRELREGAFDVVIGVNLLREGIDLPEVSLVCILDADKEGFLRSETSLIQTIGRSAGTSMPRSSSTPTKSPAPCSAPSTRPSRRRAIQIEYNTEHGITPETIKKAIRRGIEEEIQAKAEVRKAVGRDEDTDATAGIHRRSSKPRCSRPPRNLAIRTRGDRSATASTSFAAAAPIASAQAPSDQGQGKSQAKPPQSPMRSLDSPGVSSDDTSLLNRRTL